MVPETTRVALLGAGRAGKKILSLLGGRTEVTVTGVFDRDRGAPGLALARDMGIILAGTLPELLETGPDVVINVTGDPGAARDLAQRLPPDTQVCDGEATRLVLVLAEIQNRVQEELRQSLRDQQSLYRSGLELTAAKSLSAVLNQILDRATALLETPAGSISLYDDEHDEFRMAAAKGLSKGFLDGAGRAQVRKGGLNEIILGSDGPVSIEDTDASPDVLNPALAEEGIRSILACTLKTGKKPVGILYVDDFHPRAYSDRHKSLISLFSSQAAIALEKFRLTQRLQDANRYLESILRDSGDMILTTDTDGRIVRFNRGGEQILGFTAEEMVGTRARDLYVNPVERDVILEELRRCGEVRNRETTLRRKDDTPVEISLTISTLRNSDGEEIGTVGISKDVTKEKFLRTVLEERNRELNELNDRLEEKVLERTRELEKLNEELDRANRLKSRFIANMSHELRTPLNAIIGFSDILLDEGYGPLNDSQRRYAENITTSGKHLLQLVNNILDLAKIEAGRFELVVQPCAVGEIIAEVAAVMRAMSERKNVALVLESDPSIPDLDGDRVKVKQILYNLLSNAIKFTPEGGVVSLHSSSIVNDGSAVPWAPEGQRFCVVSVRDTGVGIGPEHLEKIFDEFEQADASLAREHEGAGLGLALSQRLAEMHGGHITAESVPGRGSTFVLYLPYHAPAGYAEAGQAAASEGTVPDVLSELALRNGDSPLVLVIEDDAATSEILTIHMTQAGYRVAHAFNGEEAIEKAIDLKPFLITLDVMLPKKDGWEVLQILKSRSETRDIPVIVHSIVDNRELASSLGAADYILKPVDKDVLLRRMTEIARYRQKQPIPLSVLVVSKDEVLQKTLGETLAGAGFSVHWAADRTTAVDLSTAIRPGVILLETGVAGAGDNIDLLFELKEHAIARDIPIFLLADGEVSVDHRLELSGKIERILQKNSFQPVELLSHIRDMEVSYPDRAGLLDDVTGVFNHRYFQIRLAQEILRTRRYGYPLSLVLLRLDDFDDYRKARGEYYGNIALRKTAELIRRSIRGSDILVRFRASTMAIILPNTPLSSALALAKRFISLVEAYPFLYEEGLPKRKLTASAGLTSFRKDHSPEQMSALAERALLRAVDFGGNRAEVEEIHP